MDELAIKIDHVSKEYRLGAIGGGTLRGDLQSWMARLKGKEDPNSKIGSDAATHMGERFLALDDVSFQVKKGEALGIIGHNGAGKSTLLKLLSRVTAPTRGTISYNGRIASMLEVGTGFHPELTGRENVYMNGAILGMTKAEISSKFDQIVEFAEMEKFIDTPVKRYSSGMYVKLAFAVAAHLDSEIMVMDEVLAVGDMKFQQKCLGKMGDAANTEGRTVLYVSHNMNTIRQLCTRCIVLDHGKMVFDGEVDEAIPLYMDRFESSAHFIDFKQRTRERKLLDGLRIESMEILGHDMWRIPVGSDLKFRVRVRATKDIERAGFRSRLTTTEGTSVSVLLARDLISCKKGEEIEFDLDADISQLVPGRYCLTPSLYAVNEFGGNDFYDHLESAVLFEIENVLGFNENMAWEQRWWGNIKLPELKVDEIHYLSTKY